MQRGAFQEQTFGVQRRNIGERLVVTIGHDDLRRPRVSRGRGFEEFMEMGGRFEEFRECGRLKTFVFSHRSGKLETTNRKPRHSIGKETVKKT